MANGDPYQPPAANLEFAAPVSRDAVAIRQAHVGHERQLKSVGLLFGLGAVMLLIALFALMMPGDSGAPEVSRQMAGVMASGAMLAFFAVTCAVLAFGYRTLAPWVKYVGTPVSVLGLLALPVGTLIHAYILYLLWCAKGRRVLSPDYAEIIRATPDVRYKATTGDWIALALLVLLFAGIAAMFLT